VKASRIDRVKSMMKVLDQVWALPFSYLAMRKIGVKKLDPEQISEGLRRLNERLRNDRTKMRSQRMIRLCDLLIELNELGIQLNDTYVKERELSAQCLKLKRCGCRTNFLPSLSKQDATRDAYSSSRLITTSTP